MIDATPYLDAVAPRLAGVMAPGELAACRAVLAAIPAIAPRTFVFECPLAGEAPRADVAYSFDRPSAGLTALRVAGLPAAVAALLDRLDEPGAPAASTLWLEHDLDRPVTDPPSVFLGDADLSGAGAGARGPERLAYLLAALGPVDDAMASALAACHRALPPGAALFQVGRMLPRPGAPVRLCIRHVPAAGLDAFLAAAAPDRVLRLPAAARAFVAEHRPFVLDVDLEPGRGVGHRVGIELIVEDRSPGKVIPLLDELVARGLCAPGKRDLVAGWAGVTAYRRDDAPRPIADVCALVGGRARAGHLRLVSHLKLVCEHEQIIAAKAYLCLRYFVTSPKGIRDAQDGHDDRVPGSP
jgi:hypothetical protein